MKLWMELRDSGLCSPSYRELRNAFTTLIYRREKKDFRRTAGRTDQRQRTQTQEEQNNTQNHKHSGRWMKSATIMLEMREEVLIHPGHPCPRLDLSTAGRVQLRLLNSSSWRQRSNFGSCWRQQQKCPNVEEHTS